MTEGALRAETNTYIVGLLHRDYDTGDGGVDGVNLNCRVTGREGGAGSSVVGQVLRGKAHASSNHGLPFLSRMISNPKISKQLKPVLSSPSNEWYTWLK